MPSQVTITAKTGPGQTVTSLVLTGVTEMNYQTFPRSLLKVVHDKGQSEFDIQAQTTWTITLSGGNVTVVVS